MSGQGQCTTEGMEPFAGCILTAKAVVRYEGGRKAMMLYISTK
jgi:hypothetical protein